MHRVGAFERNGQDKATKKVKYKPDKIKFLIFCLQMQETSDVTE